MDMGMMSWVHAACTAECYTAYDCNAVAPKYISRLSHDYRQPSRMMKQDSLRDSYVLNPRQACCFVPVLLADLEQATGVAISEQLCI